MLGYISPTITSSIEEFLDQPIFLNPQTKLDFCSNNPYFCVPSKNVSDKFTSMVGIKDLCRFLQPGLISSMTFEKELGLSNDNHEIMYKLIMDLIVKTGST